MMGRSPYKLGYYWCSRCGRYVKALECFRDLHGYLRHKECGSRVRTSPKRVRSSKKPIKPMIIVREGML